MRPWILIIVATAFVFASAASGRPGEPAQESQEDLGPPHENLGRRGEQVYAVICRSPNRDAEIKKFEEEFRARRKAVHREVVREYGEEVANRTYLTTGPCYSFRSDDEFQERLSQAKDAYRAMLVYWETRYGIGPRETEK